MALKPRAELWALHTPGPIGCDYYSAYHKYLRNSGGSVQFCLAHLIRELRFLREHQNPEVKKYATRSLAAMKRLFRLYHRRLDKPGEERRELAKAGEVLWRMIVRAPPEQKAENIAKRFLDLRDPYLTFISNPQVEPTNNQAEQAIRQVVINRASSQGAGGKWPCLQGACVDGIDHLRHAGRFCLRFYP